MLLFKIVPKDPGFSSFLVLPYQYMLFVLIVFSSKLGIKSRLQGKDKKGKRTHFKHIFPFINSSIKNILTRIPHNRIPSIFHWQELLYMALLQCQWVWGNVSECQKATLNFIFLLVKEELKIIIECKPKIRMVNASAQERYTLYSFFRFNVLKIILFYVHQCLACM